MIPYTLFLIILIEFANAERQLRWPPTIASQEGQLDLDNDQDHCDRCCLNDCDSQIGYLHGLAQAMSEPCTPVHIQEGHQNTQLVCDFADSLPIKRIEFDGSYQFPTTCSGILSGRLYANDFYTLVLDDNGSERRQNISGDYTWISNFNNGNLLYYFEAQLTACHCDGSILKGFFVALADNPLTDCCAAGVTHLLCRYGVVQIYSDDKECCARCRVGTTSVAYERPVTNSIVA